MIYGIFLSGVFMQQVNVEQAKVELTVLIEAALNGEEVVH